jgi:hypothetical protein
MKKTFTHSYLHFCNCCEDSKLFSFTKAAAEMEYTYSGISKVASKFGISAEHLILCINQFKSSRNNYGNK